MSPAIIISATQSLCTILATEETCIMCQDFQEANCFDGMGGGYNTVIGAYSTELRDIFIEEWNRISPESCGRLLVIIKRAIGILKTS